MLLVPHPQTGYLWEILSCFVLTHVQPREISSFQFSCFLSVGITTVSSCTGYSGTLCLGLGRLTPSEPSTWCHFPPEGEDLTCEREALSEFRGSTDSEWPGTRVWCRDLLRQDHVCTTWQYANRLPSPPQSWVWCPLSGLSSWLHGQFSFHTTSITAEAPRPEDWTTPGRPSVSFFPSYFTTSSVRWVF